MYPFSSVPMIQLPIAEMLYVAFDSTLDYLESHTDYPPGMLENMRKVTAKYDHDRSLSMTSRGYKADFISTYTGVASEKLSQWLDEKAAKTEESEGHFDEWRKELDGGD